MDIQLTFDIESLKEINLIARLAEKHKKQAIFFVPAKLLEKNPKIFLSLKKKKYIIGLHGYEHERFDLLNNQEKEKRLLKSIAVYKKIFKTSPKYFRAPQFSLDSELLKLLEKYSFAYDSSVVQFPLFQLIFFPLRLSLYLNQVKLKNQKNKIREEPVSSFILPISMFSLRILPLSLFKILAKLSLIFRKDKKLIFLAHSYDFKNKKIINKFEKFLE